MKLPNVRYVPECVSNMISLGELATHAYVQKKKNSFFKGEKMIIIFIC